MRSSITAHCIVKNEENFVWYAVMSVIDFVDQIIIFDTGSTDKTVSIVKKIQEACPDKILFEEKGGTDKARHTLLRNEMIERTKTDWFMVLDGDEVWTQRGLVEAKSYIDTDGVVECLIAPFYLCVGDVYHGYYKKGSYEMLGKKGSFSPRFVKCTKGVHWKGDYNSDALVFDDGEPVFRKQNTIFLEQKYWHMTHLRRSSMDDTDYSSYGTRMSKRRETYFFIGRRIKEKVPKVLSNFPEMGFFVSCKNFLFFLMKRF